MKRTSLNLVSILLFILLMYNKALCQCSCFEGEVPIVFIDGDTAKKYIDNYEKGYRQLEQGSKLHSISVDFSRKAILDFVYKVFEMEAAKNYKGVGIYFSVYRNLILQPGQSSKMQIGLQLLPINSDCKWVLTEMNLMNNSFDQDEHNYKPISSTKTNSANNANNFVQNYKTYFTANGTDQNHSRSVSLTSEAFGFIKDFLIKNPSYSGIRIFFASYNQSGKVCSQVTLNQITLLIAPTDQHGKADFDAFTNYAMKQYGLTDKTKVDFFKVLNHGSLCPDVCPDE